MPKEIRLRYAPSPTGFLHIGNARTALINYIFAKHYNGKFIVRVEDTDYERNVEGALESQFDNLEWLNIFHDESYLKPQKKYGEYVQSKKIDRYVLLANELIDKKLAYKCYCSFEELEKIKEEQLARGVLSPKYPGICKKYIGQEKKEPYNIRILTPENKIFSIEDIIRGHVEFNSNEIGDFIIIKSNGIATYNFAVVIDDHDMEITHVVRGEEHISNTPKQLIIYDALKYPIPQFCHLTLIVDDSKKKLSKRSSNSFFFIEEYRNKGFLPEAIFNYIAFLGWSPKNEQEIYSSKELIKIFSEKNFSKSPSTFDMNKMKWYNGQWMKKISNEDYLKFIKKFIVNKDIIKNINKENLDEILILFKNEIEYGEQINNHIDIFLEKKSLDKETLDLFENEYISSIEMISTFKELLLKLRKFDDESIKEIIKQVGVQYNVKGKSLFMPIRIACSKTYHGPELAKIIYYINKATVVKNINELIEKVKK